MAARKDPCVICGSMESPMAFANDPTCCVDCEKKQAALDVAATEPYGGSGVCHHGKSAIQHPLCWSQY